ncbi:hypothetical protein CRYUN_Cryun12cG0010700 [Craigia yunnanensis]
MPIHRTLSNKTLHLRFFSQAAFAVDQSSSALPSSPFPSTYLEGFAKPDPKYAETILAVPRATSGKSIATKERKVGRIPSIVFEQKDVRSEFGTGDLIEKVRVLLRMLHLHAGTDAPLNVTFIRAPSQALLKVDVPLVFRGEDVCPGLRKGKELK